MAKESSKGTSKASTKSMPSKGSAAHQGEKHIPKTLWLGAAGLIIAAIFVFSPAFDNGFVNWDDQAYVEEQPMVLQKEYSRLLTTPVSLNYHPVTMISLAMQAPDKGEKLTAASFIRMNVAIHICNALLVLWLVWLMSGYRLGVALFTSFVFALHPLHIESVVWVSERKDVLYTFFFLLSCLSFWYYLTTERRKWLFVTLICFIFSVLSKAMAVSLPVVLLLLLYIKHRNWHFLRHSAYLLPFFAISLFFGLMAMNVQGGGDFHGLLNLYGEKVNALAAPDTFTLWQRIQFACYGFVSYLVQFFYPLSICAFYPYPDPATLGGAQGLYYPVMAAGVLLFAVWAGRKWPEIFFGLAFYLVTVALVLQFISVGLAIKADRYTYIPYIGIAFLVGHLGQKFAERPTTVWKNVIVGLALVFISMLGFKSRQQADVWQDSEVLWSQVLLLFPNEDLALGNRGNYRGKTGNIEGAFSDFQQAIADGCRRADVYEGLGNCYGTMSELQPGQKQALVQKAIEAYQKGLEIEPNRGNIHFNLGVAQLSSNPKASAQSYKKALEIMPYKEKEILPPLGLALLNSGAYEEAVSTLSKAIALNGPNENTLYHRGLAYIGLSRPVEARKDLQAVLAINPSQPEVPSKLQYLNEKFGAE